MPASNAGQRKLNTKVEDCAYTVGIKNEVEILKEKKPKKNQAENTI